MPTIAGTVYGPDGAPAESRIVRLYRRDTGALLGTTLTSDGVGVPGDADFASVSLLLHFDDLGDSSGLAHSPSLIAPGVISAAQSKFGADSFYSGGGAVTVPSNSAFALPGDFTIEAWVYPVRLGGLGGVINIGDYSSGVLLRISGSGVLFYIRGSDYTFGTTISVDAWHHIAVARSGSSIRVFLDGVSSTVITNSADIPANQVTVGRSAHHASEYLNGYIDEVRITKGVARYTADFTPPVAAFPHSTAATPSTPGAYAISTLFVGEVQRVVLDNDAGDVLNDLIDRVVLA